MAYNYDPRRIGRKLGNLGRGIGGALSAGGSAKVNPEVANLEKYGEFGNSAGDASLPQFVPSGNNIFGQASQQADALNNRLRLDILGQDRTLQNALTQAKKMAEMKQIMEAAELAKAGGASRLAVGALPAQDQSLYAGIPQVLNDETFQRVLNAGYGGRIGSEGLAGIPSALEGQKNTAAAAAYTPLGAGRFNPQTREYIEGGGFNTREINTINQFGLPEKRHETIRYNPTSMTLGRVTQQDIDGPSPTGFDSFGLPTGPGQGGNVMDSIVPSYLDFGSPAAGPKPAPAPSGQAPNSPINPDLEATGLIPSAIRGGTKLINKGQSVLDDLGATKRALPEAARNVGFDLLESLFRPAGGYDRGESKPSSAPMTTEEREATLPPVKPRTEGQKQSEQQNYIVQELIDSLPPAQATKFKTWKKVHPEAGPEQMQDYIRLLNNTNNLQNYK